MPGEAYSKARRAAQQWIVEAVSEGKTGNQIVDILQKSGFGYRRSDVLADVKRVREEGTDAAAFRASDPQARIPVEMVREVETGRMVLKDAFRADFTVEGVNTLTGKYQYAQRSLSFGAAQSIRSLETMLTDALKEKEEEYQFSVRTVVLTNVFAKAVEDWEET